MFRRTANQGTFADLPVTMDLKTVRSYASEGGVGLDGVKVRIIRDESLVAHGVGYGRMRFGDSQRGASVGTAIAVAARMPKFDRYISGQRNIVANTLRQLRWG